MKGKRKNKKEAVDAIEDHSRIASASLVLGLVGLVLFAMPFIRLYFLFYLGFAVDIVALVFGVLGLRSSKRIQAIAGISLAAVALGLSVLLQALSLMLLLR